MNPKIYPVIHHLDDTTTLGEAAVARDAGADGVFLISHHGKDRDIARLAAHLCAHYNSDFKIGVNFLGWPNMHAFDVAHMAELDMLWFDNCGVTSAGLTAHGLMLNKRIHAYTGKKPEIFAGTAFKYQPHEDYPAGAAHVAAANGYIPTTSGAATGAPPTLDKIADMSALGTKALAVASGMTPRNVAAFAPLLSHILVSTGVSRDGYHFDAELLSEFIANVRAA
jgi:predicted TIM-barrel enzyme